MSRSSARDADLDGLRGDPGGRGMAMMAIVAARPEGGLHRVGRREQTARWCRCRGDRARSARRGARARAGRAGRRARRGRAAGCRRGRAARARRPARWPRVMPRPAASLWPVSSSSDDHRPVAAGDPLGVVVPRDHQHLVDQRGPAQGDEHVGEHRLHQRPAGPGVQLLGQPRLGVVERLDGQDGQGRHGGYTLACGPVEAAGRRFVRCHFRSPCANWSVCSATRRRAGPSSISTLVSSTGSERVRSSATSPSMTPA